MHKQITFPTKNQKSWRNAIAMKLKEIKPGDIQINCHQWILTCQDINYLKQLASRLHLTIISIESFHPETIVSASALGLRGFLNKKVSNSDSYRLNDKAIGQEKSQSIFFHEGTLRSGEFLEAENDLMILGDVNPGAIVSAGGNVMIWGRLLGIAHAGKDGNDRCKISALELRPVQLRISNKIARGPKEKPQEGLAEEASIEQGMIVIKPAKHS